MDSQGFESRQGKEILFSPKEKSFVQCVPGFFPGVLNGRSVRLITDLHQVPGLRMSGATPLPTAPLFIMACSGTNLPFSHLLLLRLLLISCSFLWLQIDSFICQSGADLLQICLSLRTADFKRRQISIRQTRCGG